jgi:hypothetical protein
LAVLARIRLFRLSNTLNRAIHAPSPTHRRFAGPSGDINYSIYRENPAKNPVWEKSAKVQYSFSFCHHSGGVSIRVEISCVRKARKETKPVAELLLPCCRGQAAVSSPSINPAWQTALL